MKHLAKLVLSAAFLTSPLAFAATQGITAETTPPPAEGALNWKDVGPAFSHPLPSTTPAPAPKTEAKAERKYVPLFGEEEQKKEEKNPLEEEARNEFKGLENFGNAEQAAPSSSPQHQLVQSAEIKPEEMRKELNAIEDAINPPGAQQIAPEEAKAAGDSTMLAVKSLQDPESASSAELSPAQSNESKPLDLKGKEIDLDSSPESKDLPTILR